MMIMMTAIVVVCDDVNDGEGEKDDEDVVTSSVTVISATRWHGPW